MNNNYKYCNEIIEVSKINGSNATLKMYKKQNNKWHIIVETEAFIGRNGITKSKKEGDGKTPSGVFGLGIAFGIHDISNLNVDYIKINENLHWVDDIHSKYYNKMVDVTKVNKDWQSSEHLIDYPIQYEYAIEIKTNPNNIHGNGSAIFLHCSNKKPTAGCVAIDRESMIKVLENLETTRRGKTRGGSQSSLIVINDKL